MHMVFKMGRGLTRVGSLIRVSVVMGTWVIFVSSYEKKMCINLAVLVLSHGAGRYIIWGVPR